MGRCTSPQLQARRAQPLKPSHGKQGYSYSTSAEACSPFLALSSYDGSHHNLRSLFPLLPPPAPKFKMEKQQISFLVWHYFPYPTLPPPLLTLLLGSSFSLLSALSVPCAVWQCALLPPWQGILFHRCSRNLWPNVMPPLWVNKTGQSVFRILASFHNFYHKYK